MVRFLLRGAEADRQGDDRPRRGRQHHHQRKSLDEMQRIASAEAGGPLMTPGEFNDPIGI